MSISNRTSDHIEKMRSWGVSYSVNDNYVAIITVPIACIHEFCVSGSFNDAQSVFKFMAACRSFALHTSADEIGPFLDFPKVTEGKFTFMKSTQLSFFRQLHVIDERSKFFVKFYIAYVGVSSYATYSDLVDGDNNLFFRVFTCFVLIDKLNRKSLAFPDWWVKKYKPINEQRINIPRLHKPENCFQYHVTISKCDTDAYNHTNYLSYLLFCEAALEKAMQSDIFNYMKHLELNKNKVNILYVKETLLDELLTVFVWRNQSYNEDINFHIVREGDLVCQIIFSFQMVNSVL